MNRLKRILSKPITIDHFIIYIDTKSVDKISVIPSRNYRYYDIFFLSKILDKSTNKIYQSSNGYIKGNFEDWYCLDSEKYEVDSLLCIYLDKQINEPERVQFFKYMVSNFFTENELKHIVRMSKKDPVGYKNFFIHKRNMKK